MIAADKSGDSEEGKGRYIKVKLTLDTEAADELLRLAGSPRKQGEYVSRLIHEAARPQSAQPQMDTEGLRLQMLGLSAELQRLAKLIGVKED